MLDGNGPVVAFEVMIHVVGVAVEAADVGKLGSIKVTFSNFLKQLFKFIPVETVGTFVVVSVEPWAA